MSMPNRAMHLARAGVLIALALIAFAGAAPAGAQERLVAPGIVSITPQVPTRNAAAQLLTITGRGFSAGISLTVEAPDGGKSNYDGRAIQARGESTFQVAVLLASAGPYSLTVMNTDGARSPPFVLQIRPTTGAPRIDRVRPDQLTKDSQPRVLTVSGDGFAQGQKVYLTDPIGTVYLITGSAIASLSQTSFDISVTIAMTGDYSLLVINPSGESSNNMTITVVMPR